MVEFVAYSSEAVVSRAFISISAICLNVLKRNLPSRALAGSNMQCSMSTNQFTILKGLHSA